MGVMAQGLSSGLNPADMDTSVRPGDSFYQYACGGWIKSHPMPAAYSRYGSFDKLAEDNNIRINTLLTELLQGKGYEKGTIEQKLSDFYKLAMDSTRRNKEGVAPIKPILKEMDKAKSVAQLKAVQLKYAPFGYGLPFGAGFGADEKNASQNILNVNQGGIALGQKEYYTDTDEATTAIREAYKTFIANMFKLCGYNKEAQQAVQDIVKIETVLAKASKSRTELRDVEANYNKTTMADFEKLYPNLPLKKVFMAEGVKEEHLQNIVVGQPLFLAEADKLFATLTPGELRHYMQWNVILGAANYLSDEMSNEYFNFFGKTMRGRKEDYPRWKRATNQVESQMGEALGRMYVAKYFPAAAKERMQNLVKQLQLSLAERIEKQTWMSEDTKKAALDKLNSFYVKIGYPNKWTDLSALVIDPAKSYYDNVQACRLFWDKWDLDHKAGKPVDREDWYMYPQTVNAYYNPTTNEICFPAAILQPPFFDPQADDAVNYGGIGAVIGHEMSHGFDDQGCQFDKTGNQRNWWTGADKANFDKRAKVLVESFGKFEVLPGVKVNGELTLGENIGDNGGLNISFRALQNSMKEHPLAVKDGFTPEQRFFLSWARVWASNASPQVLDYLVKSDPHSPNEARVNAALSHIDAWYKAFNVKKGDKLFLPKNKRAHIW